MTTTGEENRFGWFTLDDEQAARILAGDMSAVWEFIEQNRDKLTSWARKFIRNKLYFLSPDFYEADEFINQIYVDFPYYDLLDRRTLTISIYQTFRGISCGGCKRYHKAKTAREISLNAPLTTSARSGDKQDGDELGNFLPSREPLPSAALERKEHVKEIAPRYFHEIKRYFGQDEQQTRQSEATIGEMLAAQNGEEAPYDAFRDVIEEVFFGFTFEEIRTFAKRQTA